MNEPSDSQIIKELSDKVDSLILSCKIGVVTYLAAVSDSLKGGDVREVEVAF